jgi:CheY-like chemotaxis protein
VPDGEEALRFLRRAGEHASAPRPGLVLLDLNLPRLHGLAVLAMVKADPNLMPLPVIALPSSTDSGAPRGDEEPTYGAALVASA